MKGHLPFAFISPSGASSNDPLPAHPPQQLFKEINNLVREQIGTIATLGGMIQGRGMIPKTRSGKTLRRCLRELVENATQGEYDKAINIPATVEDKDVVEVARARVKEYFEKRKEGESGTLKAKL